MALSVLESQVINNGIIAANRLLNEVKPVVDQIDIIYNASGGASSTITQDNLNLSANLSGLPSSSWTTRCTPSRPRSRATSSRPSRSWRNWRRVRRRERDHHRRLNRVKRTTAHLCRRGHAVFRAAQYRLPVLELLGHAGLRDVQRRSLGELRRHHHSRCGRYEHLLLRRLPVRHRGWYLLRGVFLSGWWWTGGD